MRIYVGNLSYDMTDDEMKIDMHETAERPDAIQPAIVQNRRRDVIQAGQENQDVGSRDPGNGGDCIRGSPGIR